MTNVEYDLFTLYLRVTPVFISHLRVYKFGHVKSINVSATANRLWHLSHGNLAKGSDPCKTIITP